MKRKVSYRWNLRQRMAERGMFSTTDLAPHLEDRGVHLSPAQVYRLVVQVPERLNLHTLAALCDILGCTPAELIEPVVEERRRARTKASGSRRSSGRATPPKPVRARVIRDR